MKILYLLRHAKAQEHMPDRKDFDRELIEKGISDSRLIGKRLNELGARPDLIISSPAARALQTAIIVATNLGFHADRIVQEKDLYQAESEDYLDLLSRIDDDYQSVMLVGHNPGISDFAYFMCSKFPESLSKGAVAAMEFKEDKWMDLGKMSGKRIFIETPKNLRR